MGIQMKQDWPRVRHCWSWRWGHGCSVCYTGHLFGIVHSEMFKSFFFLKAHGRQVVRKPKRDSKDIENNVAQEKARVRGSRQVSWASMDGELAGVSAGVLLLHSWEQTPDPVCRCLRRTWLAKAPEAFSAPWNAESLILPSSHQAPRTPQAHLLLKSHLGEYSEFLSLMF